jgi:type III secretion protein J
MKLSLSWPVATAAVVILLSGCAVPIAADLDEGSANRVVVTLDEGGITATKEPDPDHEGRWRITVQKNDGPSAVALLDDSNLPPSPTPGVLDALGDGSIVPSRASEHARLVAGTAGELERSFREVDGILAARVHLAVPPKDVLLIGGQTQLPTASVLLRHRGPTLPLSELDIQRLVAGAVPGLDPKHVSVVATPVAGTRTSTDRPLAHFGPITVTRSSLTPLRVAVAAIVAFDLALLAAVVFGWLRLRRAELALEAARDEAASGGAT